MMKFPDGLTKLRSLVHDAGLQGTWSDENGYHQFRSEDGGILNLWPNSTINFQGRSPGKEELEAAIQAYLDSKSSIMDHFE